MPPCGPPGGSSPTGEAARNNTEGTEPKHLCFSAPAVSEGMTSWTSPHTQPATERRRSGRIYGGRRGQRKPGWEDGLHFKKVQLE
eukprot:scaffold89683_cov23-Tisochrysis_lutea.AAC.1